MRMISEAEAFGGPWVANRTGWAVMLGPSILIVLLQETDAPFSSVWIVLLSALTQHLFAGIASLGFVKLLRLRWRVLPVPVAFAVWILIGCVRGFTGGAFALADGLPANFAERTLFWIAVSIVWMPLIAYTLAQLDARRSLSAEVATLTARRDAQLVVVQRTATESERELVAAVRDAVAPLVDDVRARLQQASVEDTELPLAPISSLLESIAHEAADIIEPPAVAERSESQLPEARFSALAEALTFDRSRPVFAAAVTTGAVAIMLVPAALLEDGLRQGVPVTASVAAGGLALLLALLALRALPSLSPVITVCGFVFSGLIAGATLFALETAPLRDTDLAYIAALPLAFASAAFVLSSAVGLAEANLKLLAEHDALRAELTLLAARSQGTDTVARRQVAQLMHGPLLGRLSARVMALNFYLAEPEQNRRLRRAATVEGVRAHLELIADDMEKLARQRG